MTRERPRPDLAAVVVDASALVADLFLDGPARETMDHVRAHSWLDLVVSDPLLGEAQSAVAALGDETLAADWRARVEARATRVDHPPDDHPALACAYRARAAHVVTYDERLLGASAGVRIKKYVETSVLEPAAFAGRFDPAAVYETAVDGAYPGPDADPRA